ncbi:Lipoprotein OS=Streptomyces cyaneofuscatus OX=66883 GN=G3I52_05970 PE=4 SV=1 [Streptomyces cyaneofuscatus]
MRATDAEGAEATDDDTPRAGRLTAALATATVLCVTASGCVTVHGELEVLPGATEAEAAQALTDFITAYNAADRAYDPALDADRVTGSLGAINQAGLRRARRTAPAATRRTSLWS